MVKNPAPAPALAGIAIKIRKIRLRPDLEKANLVQPYDQQMITSES